VGSGLGLVEIPPPPKKGEVQPVGCSSWRGCGGGGWFDRRIGVDQFPPQFLVARLEDLSVSAIDTLLRSTAHGLLLLAPDGPALRRALVKGLVRLWSSLFPRRLGGGGKSSTAASCPRRFIFFF